MIKKIIILKPSRPLNFSESMNAGVHNSNNPYIFLINDDILIGKGTIEELVKNTDNNTITGPDSNCGVMFQTDYAYTVKGIKLLPAMSLSVIKPIIKDVCSTIPIFTKKVERDWLAYFATMFTRKCWNDIGDMDENFWYDMEDLDHSIRARKIGKKFLQIFSSYCFHFGGVSRKVKHVEVGDTLHYAEHQRNLNYFRSKHGEGII